MSSKSATNEKMTETTIKIKKKLKPKMSSKPSENPHEKMTETTIKIYNDVDDVETTPLNDFELFDLMTHDIWEDEKSGFEFCLCEEMYYDRIEVKKQISFMLSRLRMILTLKQLETLKKNYNHKVYGKKLTADMDEIVMERFQRLLYCYYKVSNSKIRFLKELTRPRYYAKKIEIYEYATSKKIAYARQKNEKDNYCLWCDCRHHIDRKRLGGVRALKNHLSKFHNEFDWWQISEYWLDTRINPELF